MKICFHWFNLSTPPGMSVGASLLARELAEAGHEVRLLHLNESIGMPFDRDRLAAFFDEHSFDLHALSFGQNHFPVAMDMASLVKRLDPSCKVLCGGVHTTLNAETVLSHPSVDFVGLGEVDGLISRFVSALQGRGDHRSVPNFWVKENDGIHRNQMAPLPDITRQSWPFFDGIDYAAIIRANRGFAETIVGRGCPMKCNYCHNAAILDTLRKLTPGKITGATYCRQRSVEDVIGELKAFKERYPGILKAFNFGDDRFASSHEWLREFSAAYAAEIGLPFICNAIAGHLDEKMAHLLADAGCYMVKFGVESGSERVRKQILARELSESRLRKVVALLQRLGVNTRAYVMLGMPTESHEEMLATIRLCADLGFDSVRPSIMYPFPGTELYRTCLAQGLVDESRVPPDYSTTTVLKLPEQEKLFIEKTEALYAWLLNLYFNDRAAEASGKLVDLVRGMPGDRWRAGEGRRRIAEEGVKIHADLRRKGIEHYFAPFTDRPDVIFLFRDRIQPLINVEER
ncbi:MAG TPA: radical SAM protein [Myxococcota bacterium]|nr:radical SAM protein [Myxococcota bacterium]